MNRCPECQGAGEFFTSHRFDCHICKGTGVLTDKELDIYNTREEELKLRQKTYSRLENQLYSYIDSFPPSEWSKLTLLPKKDKEQEIEPWE